MWMMSSVTRVLLQPSVSDTVSASWKHAAVLPMKLLRSCNMSRCSGEGVQARVLPVAHSVQILLHTTSQASVRPHLSCNGILAELQHEVRVLIANDIMVLQWRQ